MNGGEVALLNVGKGATQAAKIARDEAWRNICRAIGVVCSYAALISDANTRAFVERDPADRIRAVVASHRYERQWREWLLGDQSIYLP
jgi:hypothetical protein